MHAALAWPATIKTKRPRAAVSLGALMHFPGDLLRIMMFILFRFDLTLCSKQNVVSERH
jgi:hypothetical protein